jgi:hypothetical protein
VNSGERQTQHELTLGSVNVVDESVSRERKSVTAPPTAAICCGRFGLLFPSDDPNVEGEHHLCGLAAGHIGACLCACGQPFSPWTKPVAVRQDVGP